MIKLINGDCLVEMASIEDGSIDMILCDLPYGTMKGVLLDGWNKDSTKWDVCINHEELLSHYNRILRLNGALVLFSQDPFTAMLMTETHGNLPFSYRYTWVKNHFATPLMSKKAPVNYTEDICVFFKKYDTQSQHPLREYAKSIFNFIGKEKKELFVEMGHQGVCHFYRYDSMQFGICTEKTYSQLIKQYGIDKLPEFKLYSEIKDIDRRFSRRFSRRFNIHDNKFKSNILYYKKDSSHLHPTQKPVNLLENIIKTYTNEGETVLDNCFGSCSTGVACINTNRLFIGIEMDKTYFDIGVERMEIAEARINAL